VYTVKQYQFEHKPVSTQDASGRGAHNSRFPSNGLVAPLLFPPLLLLCVGLCARVWLFRILEGYSVELAYSRPGWLQQSATVSTSVNNRLGQVCATS